MSHEKYIRHDLDSCLGHLIEECGEVQAAAGKILRWGWYSVNPELPPEEQEKNIDWLEREITDLQGAINRMRLALRESMPTARRPTAKANEA